MRSARRAHTEAQAAACAPGARGPLCDRRGVKASVCVRYLLCVTVPCHDLTKAPAEHLCNTPTLKYVHDACPRPSYDGAHARASIRNLSHSTAAMVLGRAFTLQLVLTARKAVCARV